MRVAASAHNDGPAIQRLRSAGSTGSAPERTPPDIGLNSRAGIQSVGPAGTLLPHCRQVALRDDASLGLQQRGAALADHHD
jgi:hypothetical protein